MPGFDKTGPMGEGSRTGRGFGRCGKTKEAQQSNITQDSNNQDYEIPAGRGLGRGQGRGSGGRGAGRCAGRGGGRRAGR